MKPQFAIEQEAPDHFGIALDTFLLFALAVLVLAAVKGWLP